MNGAAHYEKLKRPPIREKRIGGINAYYGKISDLIEEFESSGGVQRVRTYTQTLEDELTYAIRALLTLRGGVLVVHGPRGCAMAVFAAVSVLGRGRTYPCLARCYSTDLSEKDSIMGSEKKLRDAVRRACEEHRPKHIFILTTPVVAINNDDVISAAREMSEQLGVRILPVFTDGFKSRMPQTGSDYAFHAIFGMLRGARGETAAGEESGAIAHGGESRIPAGAGPWRVSVAAVNTSAEDMDELIRMLQEAGIEAEPFFKAMNETDEKGGLVLPEAELFLCVGPEETGYFAECLNSDAAARALSVAPPVGLEGSRRWIRVIAKALGKTVPDTPPWAGRIPAAADNEGKNLSGIRAYLSLPLSWAPGFAGLIREMGGDIAGISVDAVDQTGLDYLRKLEPLISGSEPNDQAPLIHVSGFQEFELYNILGKRRPSLFVGRGSQVLTAARMGIPSISLDSRAFYGIRGAVRFVEAALRAVRFHGFPDILKDDETGGAPAYEHRWAERRPDWYIKLEGKY